MGNTWGYLLGIDVGGTAVKVCLFDLSGRLLAKYAADVPVLTPRPGWAEIDPNHWFRHIAQGIRYVLEQGRVSPYQVVALGLSNMIGTVVPLDKRGTPLRPAIAYFDTRSAAEAEWILDKAPEIPQISANRVISGNTTVASILWIRRYEPEIYKQSALFAQTGTLLFRWLTGETAVDWTNASFMGIFDYRRKDWNSDIAAKLDLDLELFAPVEPPHRVAPLCAKVARELGLCPRTLVALGGIDGAMSSLGVGAIHEGDAFDVSGTSEMIAVCLSKPVLCPELLARWHVVPDVWVLIGAISTSGAAWRWFSSLFGGTQDADLYERMTNGAAMAPPGANGVIFLPHLMGERAPIWNSHARGVFFGLSLSTTRGDLARAVMEGTAYTLYWIMELIQRYGGVSFRRVVMAGGAARNRLWRQIKADVWNVEVALAGVEESSALGAALTAGVGAGIYADYGEAVRRAVPQPKDPVFPDPSRHQVYERGYQIYRRLYPALSDLWRLAF